MLNKALSALTSYILWGFVFSFAYMNRLLKARLFFDYSPREKNYEVETQRLWGPLKWCTATSPNRKFIMGKKNRKHGAQIGMKLYPTDRSPFLCLCGYNLWHHCGLQTRWRSWLRHCATSRKVVGSIPYGII